MLAHRARLSSYLGLAFLVTLGCSKRKAASPKSPSSQPPVLVVFDAPGLSSQAVESQVTNPAIVAVTSLVGVKDVESLSMDSVATLAVTFETGSDVFELRAKLQSVSWTGLPSGVHAVLAPASQPRPVAVYQISSESLTPVTLRALQDQTLSLPVLALPGVSYVSVCGGALEELQIEIDSKHSTAYEIALSTVASQIRSSEELSETKNNTELLETILQLIIAEKQSNPAFLQDIATVRVGTMPPTCLASASAIPVVEVQVFATPGADSHAVAAAAKEAIASHSAGADITLTWATGPEIRVAVEVSGTDATGSNLRQVHKTSQEVARRIERYPGVQHVSSRAGIPTNDIVLRDGSNAELRVFLSSDADVAMLAAKIEAESNFPNIHLRSSVVKTSDISVTANRVRIYGPELDVLGMLAAKLQSSLEALEAVQSTQLFSHHEIARPSFNIKREEAAQLGMTTHDIQEVLLAANEGLMIRTSRMGPSALRLTLGGVQTPQELATHSIMTPRGAVPLGQLVSIELVAGPSIIRAHNTRRYVEVQSTASGNHNEIRAAIAKAVQLPAQYELGWERAPRR